MTSYEPFGQVAIKLGFVTSAQVESALDIQKSLEHSGKGRKLLGMIFIETGMISSAQLIDILQYYDHLRTAAAAKPDDQTKPS
jgi:hypothetical protein